MLELTIGSGDEDVGGPSSLGDLPSTEAVRGLSTIGSSRHATIATSELGAAMALTPLTPLTYVAPTIPALSTEAIEVGPYSPPVPQKRAERIWKGEFIELRDLLPTQLGEAEPTFLDLLSKPEKNIRPQKNVTTIGSGEYVLIPSPAYVVVMQQPDRMRELLAYSGTIIKVTGYSCARRAKCIGKCILKLANQESRVRRA